MSASSVPQALEFDALLDGQQFFFFRMKMSVLADHLTFLKLATDRCILDVVFETTHVIRFDILFAILTASWNGGRLNHLNQVGEALLLAVVRGGTCQHQTLTLPGQKLSQIPSLTAPI